MLLALLVTAHRWALHRLHRSPAGAVAVYDLRLGAVVVATHAPGFLDGQTVDVTLPVGGDDGEIEAE